jgi:hypothetical protein
LIANHANETPKPPVFTARLATGVRLIVDHKRMFRALTGADRLNFLGEFNRLMAPLLHGKPRSESCETLCWQPRLCLKENPQNGVSYMDETPAQSFGMSGCGASHPLVPVRSGPGQGS